MIKRIFLGGDSSSDCVGEGSAESARPELDTSYVVIVAVVTCRGFETAD